MKKNNPTYQELAEKVSELEDRLVKTQWLHQNNNVADEEPYIPFYGDVTQLNTERTILDTVGKETLDNLTSELMDLLDTSVAIYEKNGDYAYGVFKSGWCQLMDASSRKLCNTDDNKTALSCGKWLCHDDCWNNSAKAAIKTKKSTDIDCVGAIKLYGEPIFVGNEVIGIINIGYGNPPTDEKTLLELAEKYKVDFEILKQKALGYNPRPDFIINIAKKRLKSIAKLIGEIVSRKQTVQALKESEENLKSIVENITNVFYKHDTNHKLTYISPQIKHLLGYNAEEAKQLWTEFVTDNPVNEKGFKKTVEAIKTGKRQEKYDLELRHKNGHHIWVEVHESPIVKNGKTVEITGALTDATNQRKFQKELKESEAKLSLILESFPEPVYLVSPNFELIFANEVMKKIYGDNIIGQKCYQTIYKKNKPCNWCVYPKLSNKNRIEKYERYFEREDKHRIVTNILLDDKSKLTIYYDITERKKTEEALKENEKKYRNLIETMQEGIWQIDVESNTTYVNEKMADILGYSPQEMMGKHLFSFMDKQGVKIATELLENRRKGIREQHDFEFIKKNGERIYLLLETVSLTDNEGNYAGSLATAMDISKRRNAQQALKKSEEKLNLIVNESPFPVAITDINDEEILYWSKNAKELTGHSPKTVSEWYELAYPDPVYRKQVIERWKPYLKKARESSTAVNTGEYRITCKDGSIKNVEFYVQFIPGNLVITINDITERKKDEEALKEHKNMLEKLNKDKDQFISILAHDIKGPFSSIIGFSELLVKKAHKYDVEEIIMQAGMINKLANRTFDILDDTLLWSKAQSNRYILEPSNINVSEILDAELQVLNHQANGKQILIINKIQDSLQLCTDVNVLKTIFRNLISNAIKFTHEGGHITIDANKNKDEIVFCVSDTGIGISKDRIDQLFELDQLNTTEGTKQEKGTGFGLKICKELLNQLAGTIWVESVPDKGTTFFFAIPVNLNRVN